MKSAVFLYNTQSGKCKIGHCTDSICTVFRAYGYEITPQPILCLRSSGVRCEVVVKMPKLKILTK